MSLWRCLIVLVMFRHVASSDSHSSSTYLFFQFQRFQLWLANLLSDACSHYSSLKSAVSRSKACAKNLETFLIRPWRNPYILIETLSWSNIQYSVFKVLRAMIIVVDCKFIVWRARFMFAYRLTFRSDEVILSPSDRYMQINKKGPVL
jgi:hypothetical protein